MSMRSQDYEKLGVFYLGREFDVEKRAPRDDLVLYDAKDLVTHAVIVGMTGSGKTGLGIALLEEAAIDGIPALIIDPKGDLANLLLTFPKLEADDFAPWVNPEDAKRKGQTPQEYAATQAELWSKGLAEWGQDGGRIARLREAVEIGLYTPGSNAATPLSIVQSFAAPPEEVQADSEIFRERVANAATSLLSLLGLGDDPLQSREHILLSSILAQFWKEGKDLDLPSLIHALQTPPFTRVGVMDLDSFFPAKDRFALAMRLNNMLASPGFEAWLQGPPLDIAALLFTPQGKPRLAILSIAHLGDKERMFFVSLLLNQVLTWMRAQPGTTSLRALLYMDEIFGYFPPVANPPSKQPLLTLLKQARAFGLGVVLATQNPVDLDYKGLSNTGSWFLGRLQTERDKDRVLDGLEGAAATTGSDFDRATMDRLLSGLGNRVFLMNNVHDDGPILFQVRWAMSYLRGPLTRAQLKTLPASADNAPAEAADRAQGPVKKPLAGSDARPVLPPEVKQYFVPPFTPPPPGCSLVYLPRILGMATVYFDDAKKGVDHEAAVNFLAECADRPGGLAWSEAASARLAAADLAGEPQAGATFGEVPSAAAKAKSYDAWKKTLTDFLYRDYVLELLEAPELGELSRPGESERDFRSRLTQQSREERDLQAEKLRQKLAPKMATLGERIRKAEVAVEKEKSQASRSKVDTALSFGSTILGAFLGRKKVSVTNVNKATSTARGVGRSMKEAQDVQYAEQNVAALKAQLAELERQFAGEVQKIQERLDPATAELTPRSLKPKKANIQVSLTALAWAPFWKSQEGFLSAAWRK